MPIKGMKETRRKVSMALKSIPEKLAPAAVMEALIIGTGAAAILTPVDTSNLINSQFRRLTYTGDTKTVGLCGYTAAYAAAVHGMSGKLKGQPRAHFGKTRSGSEFGGGTGIGNYWDPQAEPEFLTKGFEQSKDAIDAAIKRRMQM